MGQRSHIVGGSLNILISFPLLTLIQYNQSLMLSWIMFFSGMDCQSAHPVSKIWELGSASFQLSLAIPIGDLLAINNLFSF